MPCPKRFVKMSFLVAILVAFAGSLGAADDDTLTVQIQNKSLGYWVTQATQDSGPQDLQQTVSALSAALEMDNPMIKVAAADALAVLGPRAAKAVPALLAQFGHEFPWVRVSCQAAVGSVGKAAVPSLVASILSRSRFPVPACPGCLRRPRRRSLPFNFRHPVPESFEGAHSHQVGILRGHRM